MNNVAQLPNTSNPFDDDAMAAAAPKKAKKKAKGAMKLDSTSEKGIAVYVIERARSAGKPFSYADGAFWAYDPARGVWAYKAREAIGREISALDGTLVKSGTTMSEVKITIKMIDGVVKHMALLLTEEGDFFARPNDANRARLAFKNGVLLISGEGAQIVPHSPDFRIREAIPLDWTPGMAPNADWIGHLNTLFGGAEEIEYLRRVVAASVCGIATRYAKSTWIYGGGSNGKSVVKAVIEAVTPRSTSAKHETCVSIAPQYLTDPQYRLHFAHALINVVGECPRRDLTESEAFKDMIDGKSRMLVKSLYSDTYWITPIAGHFFLINNLPHIADLSLGAWRRICLLETRGVTFVGEESAEEHGAQGRREIIDWHRRITDSPAALQSVLCWLVEGLVGLLRDGALREPASSLKAKAAWRQDCDQVAQFIGEELELEPFTPGKRSGMRASDLYAKYAKWAKENGFSHPLTSKAFGGRLQANRVQKKDYSDGAYYGVRPKGYAEGEETASLLEGR